MFSFQAYGIRISANRLIPGLLRAPPSKSTSLRVDFRGPHKFNHQLTPVSVLNNRTGREASSELALTMWKLLDAGEPRYYQMCYDGGGVRIEFTIDSGGTRVWVSWTEGVAFDSVTALFCGPVLGVVLWLRGTTCLHASAVTVDGRAVAFVGSPGAGKSSMAAAFAQRGHAVLADDVAALVDQGDGFFIWPAYPSLSLWPNTATNLFGPVKLRRIWSTLEKGTLDLGPQNKASSFRFQEGPLPLAAIYVLGVRHEMITAPLILPVTATAGLLMLIANTYMRTTLSKEHRRREFDRLSRVAKHVPIQQIDRPDDLASLPLVCQAIVDDVEAPRPLAPDG